MTKEDSIKVLCNVARAAQKAGVFSLEDAAVVLEAVRLNEQAVQAPAEAANEVG